MPFYDGVNIFGYAVKMATVDNPRRAQQNAYPGLNGVESLDQGLDGRYTTVAGLLAGSTPAALSNAEALFRSYNDGVARTLVDAFGNAWPFVKLESFEPQGRILCHAGVGGYHRAYTARFVHLL